MGLDIISVNTALAIGQSVKHGSVGRTERERERGMGGNTKLNENQMPNYRTGRK